MISRLLRSAAFLALGALFIIDPYIAPPSRPVGIAIALVCIWLLPFLLAELILMLVVSGRKDIPGDGTGTACWIFEPRDLWIGVFWTRDERGKLEFYLCPFPSLVIHVFNEPPGREQAGT